MYKSSEHLIEGRMLKWWSSIDTKKGTRRLGAGSSHHSAAHG